jgi:hypothetical protein
MIAVSAFPVIALVFFAWWKLAGKIPCCRGMKGWVARGACCPSFIRKHNFGRPVNFLVTSFKQNLSTKVKLLVGFYQVSTLLSSLYNVPYPYTYLDVQEKLQFISVDFTRALPGPCIFGSGYDFTSKLYTIGGFAVAICVGSWMMVKFTSGDSLESPRPWAKKAASWLPTVVFLAYPGFSACFFEAVQCREIEGDQWYLVADLSIKCSGAAYDLLRVVAIVCVAFWCFGLPLVVLSLLWSERRSLLQEHRPSGLAENLQDFYAPYKPQYWFFESLEFGKKLLLVGVVPAASGDLAGAVAALLITTVHLCLVLAMSPYAHRSDQFTAVCANALLSVVILISVLLKMNAGYIAGTAADGLDPDTAWKLLVASNVLVVLVSVVAYVISTAQGEQGNYKEGAPEDDLFEAFATRHDHDSSHQEPLLDSMSAAHSTGGDEEDTAEARELPVASSSSNSSSDG